jgi:hypothetical protein
MPTLAWCSYALRHVQLMFVIRKILWFKESNETMSAVRAYVNPCLIFYKDCGPSFLPHVQMLLYELSSKTCCVLFYPVSDTPATVFFGFLSSYKCIALFKHGNGISQSFFMCIQIKNQVNLRKRTLLYFINIVFAFFKIKKNVQI